MATAKKKTKTKTKPKRPAPRGDFAAHGVRVRVDTSRAAFLRWADAQTERVTASVRRSLGEDHLKLAIDRSPEAQRAWADRHEADVRARIGRALGPGGEISCDAKPPASKKPPAASKK